MKNNLLLLASVSLGACTTYWEHPTKSNNDWHADYATCEAQAGQAAGINDKYGAIRRRVLDNCLYGKGWNKE